MIGMAFVKNYTDLLITRLFLGVAEAGLFPGVAYYLTMWYCRTEIQLRQTLFFSAASIAGAFSGLLAFGIAKMDGLGGLEGWRWIFALGKSVGPFTKAMHGTLLQRNLSVQCYHESLGKIGLANEDLVQRE